MELRPFGTTDWKVPAIGLGGMPLSLEGRPDEADGIRVISAALDAGMRLIDTADVYCIDSLDIGHNERLIAKALQAWSGDASEVLVATKGGLRRPGGAWTQDGRPEHLRSACEASLLALGVESIAVYQLHAPDQRVPFAASVSALGKLQQDGKIQHIGLSNVSLAQLEVAISMVPIVSVQNRCNPFDLRPFREGIVDLCEEHGITLLTYSPVGGRRDQRRVGSDPTLSAIGRRHGATSYEVALAWLVAKSPAIIPIPGASRIESAQSSARAGDLILEPDDVTTLDRAFGLD